MKNYTGKEKEDEQHEQTDRQRYLEERQASIQKVKRNETEKQKERKKERR